MTSKTFNPLILGLVLLAFSGSAMAQLPFQGPVDYVVEFLTGSFARSAAILAVVVLGYMAFVGKLSWLVAGRVIAGVVLVFGGAAIADLFIAEVG